LREEVRMIVDQETEAVLGRIMDSLGDKLSVLEGITSEFNALRKHLRSIEEQSLKKLAERIDSHDKETHSKVGELLSTTARLDDLKKVLEDIKKLDEIDNQIKSLLSELSRIIKQEVSSVITKVEESSATQTKQMKATEGQLFDSIRESLKENSQENLKHLNALSKTTADIREEAEGNTSKLSKKIESFGRDAKKASATSQNRLDSLKTSLAETRKDLEQASHEIKRNNDILEYLNRPWWKRLFGKGRP